MTAIPVVHIDESGHTGENLLDPAQPVFVVAGVCISPETARRLASAAAGDAREAHYTQLRGSRSGRGRVVDLLNAPELTESAVLVTVQHKPYSAVGKIVDLLLEPLVAAVGGDLYADRQNIEVTNLFYGAGPVVCPRSWNELVDAFVEFVWRGSLEHAAALAAALSSAVAECGDHPLGEFLAMLPDDEWALLELHSHAPHGPPPDALDPMVSMAVAQAHLWGERIGDFELIYDASKLLGRWTERLLALRDAEVAASFYVTETNQMPTLRITSLRPAASRAVSAIQVADVIAGACAECLRGIANGKAISPFAKVLRDPGPLRFVDLDTAVWPPDSAFAAELKHHGVAL